MTDTTNATMLEQPLEQLFCDEVRAPLGFARLYQTRFLNLMKGRDGHPRIATIGDLVVHTRHSLRRTYYVGPKTLRYINNILRTAGLTLHGESA